MLYSTHYLYSYPLTVWQGKNRHLPVFFVLFFQNAQYALWEDAVLRYRVDLAQVYRAGAREKLVTHKTQALNAGNAEQIMLGVVKKERVIGTLEPANGKLGENGWADDENGCSMV